MTDQYYNLANITVTVSGPGGCIDNQMLIIEKALRDAGYHVKVRNEYPPKDDIIKQSDNKWLIVLNAEHLPWGG